MDDTLRRTILAEIRTAEEAPPEKHRHPTRPSIIAELCGKFCGPLLQNAKPKNDEKVLHGITEAAWQYMQDLEKTFRALFADTEPLVVHKIASDEITLTQKGKGWLKETAQTKTDPL